MILANDLELNQETQMLDLLRENKEALGGPWDIIAIIPTIVQHKLHLEDIAKPYGNR